MRRGRILLLLACVGVAGCAARRDVVLESARSTPAAPRAVDRHDPTPDAVEAQASPPAKPLRSFTLAVTGDILLHTSTINQALLYGTKSGLPYDFRPMFSAVKPVLAAADLAICHLETPLAPPGEALSTYPIYGVPAEIVPAIKDAGYDRCSLASNHSIDRGTKGIDTTVAALDRAGLGHAGMARNPAEAGPTVIDVKGVKVSHLSYTFGLNGLTLPKGQPWRANLIEPRRIVADARAARARGAEFVIVSMHWGVEGGSLVTPEQRALADVLTRSGAIDVIVGHHAHVLQPIETVNGRWVVFGLGNFISGMGSGTACCGASAQDGAIVEIEVKEHAGGFFVAGRPRVVPTFVDRTTYVIRPVTTSLGDPAVTAVTRSGLQQSWARTQRVLGPYLVTS